MNSIDSMSFSGWCSLRKKDNQNQKRIIFRITCNINKIFKSCFIVNQWIKNKFSEIIPQINFIINSNKIRSSLNHYSHPADCKWKWTMPNGKTYFKFFSLSKLLEYHWADRREVSAGIPTSHGSQYLGIFSLPTISQDEQIPQLPEFFCCLKYFKRFSLSRFHSFIWESDFNSWKLLTFYTSFPIFDCSPGDCG